MNRAIVLLVSVGLACNKPTPSTRTEQPGSPSDVATQPHSATEMDAVAIADAQTITTTATTDATTDATIDAGGIYDDIEGRGSCKKDDDCVLSSFQEGCCTGACSNYATNKQELAARETRANCAKTKPAVCPPPAPCPPPQHWIEAAKCKDKKCYAVGRRIP